MSVRLAVLFFALLCTLSFKSHALIASSGSISGTVKNAAGEPILSAQVLLVNEDGFFVANSYVDGDGVYAFTGLEDGKYYLVTDNYSNYVDLIYPDEICGYECYSGKSHSQEKPVKDYFLFGESLSISGGAVVANFILEKGAKFSGRVVDNESGEPMGGVYVSVRDASHWQRLYSTYTDFNGNYSLDTELPEGNYLLYTEHKDGYVNATSSGLQCYSYCSQLSFDAPNSGYITVDAEANVSGVDFALDKGAVVSGYVKDSVTGEPVADAFVLVDGGLVSDYVFTDQRGYYQTEIGLSPGRYSVFVYHSSYMDGCYGSNSCLDSAEVVLEEAERKQNINVNLRKGGGISGKVVSASSGEPLTNGIVYIYSLEKEIVYVDSLNQYGEYETRAGLDTGEYVVCAVAYGLPGYINKCAGATENECMRCDRPFEITDNPINVTAGKTRADVNFSLMLGGGISGTITDLDTGEFVEAGVDIYNEAGEYIDTFDNFYPNGDALFGFGRGLITGTYYARVFAWDEGYRLQCYGGSSKCDPSGIYSSDRGLPIEVVAGEVTEGVSFELKRIQGDVGGDLVMTTVKGRVTRVSDGASIPNVNVHGGVLASSSNSVTADERGRYVIRVVSPGVYVVNTENESGYIDVFKSNNVVEEGPYTWPNTPLMPDMNKIQNVDFSLDRGARIYGQVKDELTGTLLDGRVEVLDSNGAVVSKAVGHPGFTYATTTGLKPGSYYVRTKNRQGYIDEYYSDVSIFDPDALMSATSFVIDEGETDIKLDFGLKKGVDISVTVLDSDSGQEIKNAFVGIYDANGVRVAHGYITDGIFNPSRGLSEGAYYFVIRKYGYFSTINDVQGIDDDLLGCYWHCPLNIESFNVSPVVISSKSDNELRFFITNTAVVDETSEPTTSGGGGGGALSFSALLALLLGLKRDVRYGAVKNISIH